MVNTSDVVSRHGPKGLYLIPVPVNLYYSGMSQQNTPAKSGRGLPKVSTIPPWQGVLFVRNETSPYYGAVLRLHVEFQSAHNVGDYLSGATSGYFPVIRVNSFVHFTEDQHEELAKHCLQGVVEAEAAHNESASGTTFSRVLYAVNRLVGWIAFAPETPQAFAVSARTRSPSALCDTRADLPGPLPPQPEGSNLVQFVELQDPDLYDAVRSLAFSSSG
jgi:hypothetical protein